MISRSILIIASVFLLSGAAGAYDMKGIVAYPVPLNPHKNTLQIGDPSHSFSSHKVRLAIYDINGDIVLEKTVSGLPASWNGRNGSGRFVKPGLYIIKIEVDDDNGDYGKKTIRILVDY